MKNKKGMIGYIVGGMAMLLFITLIVVMFFDEIKNQTDEPKICKEQCELRNMTYEEYVFGGYSNSVCNCLNKNKEIETIYLQ